MRYRLSLVTAPSVEPVSTSDAKSHMRIDSSTEDTLIGNLITLARELAEQYTGQAFITQTWKMFMDEFPIKCSNAWWDGVRNGAISNLINARDSFPIPLYPLQSVTHIKTYDDEDSATTLASSNYQVSIYSGIKATPGMITLRDGGTWPTFDRNRDGIEIQFVAGYGDAGTDVPMMIRQAILEEVSFRYENRGDCGDGINSQSAMSLLDNFRLVQV